jgi:hypothetical protein
MSKCALAEVDLVWRVVWAFREESKSSEECKIGPNNIASAKIFCLVFFGMKDNSKMHQYRFVSISESYSEDQ